MRSATLIDARLFTHDINNVSSATIALIIAAWIGAGKFAIQDIIAAVFVEAVVIFLWRSAPISYYMEDTYLTLAFAGDQAKGIMEGKSSAFRYLDIRDAWAVGARSWEEAHWHVAGSPRVAAWVKALEKDPAKTKPAKSSPSA